MDGSIFLFIYILLKEKMDFFICVARSPKSLIWPGNTALLWAQEAKGMSSAASPPHFFFLRARSACASRAIGALLSSYSSLDGSDGLRRSFPTKIE